MSDQNLQILLEQLEEAFERSIAIERSAGIDSVEDAMQKNQLQRGPMSSLMSNVFSLGQAIILQEIDPENPDLIRFSNWTLIQLPTLSYRIGYYIGKTGVRQATVAKSGEPQNKVPD